MPANESSTSVAPGAQQSWGLAAGDEFIPRCWVQSRLGGGHSYEAYACFDQRLLASVVVKVVRPHLTDDESTLRTLERETTILGRVNHPVIVRGLHAELGGPRPYLAMERVPGPRLSTLLRKYGPLSIEQFLPLGMQVASALHYLHAQEIVHLDVKPSNIIMDSTPRLIDFSIARGISETETLDHVVGTDQYLAPEQAHPNRSFQVGPASDVWALGVTLIEAFTGTRPFSDSHIAASSTPLERWPQTFEEPPAALPKLPGDVADIVLRCLERDPGERPQPIEVFDALDPWAERLPRPRLTHLR